MKKILFLAVISLTLFSCTRNNDIPLDDTVRVSLSFTVKTPVAIGEELIDGGMNPLTKTPITVTEKDLIKNLWVLQYNEASPRTLVGTPKYFETVTATLIPGSQGSYSYQVILNLKKGTNQQLYFVANTTNTSFIHSLADGSNLTTFTSNNINTTDIFPAGYTPMLGIITTAIKTSALPIGGVEMGEASVRDIKMDRLYAEVNFTYEIETELAGGELHDKYPQLVIKSVTLVNSPKIIPLTRETSSTQVAFNKLEVSELNTQKISSVGQYATSSPITFYLPQNIGGIISGQDHKTAYDGNASRAESVAYLLIEAWHYDKTDNTTYIPGTFRIFLGENGKENYNVLSNYSYTINSAISDTGDQSGNANFLEADRQTNP